MSRSERAYAALSAAISSFFSTSARFATLHARVSISVRTRLAVFSHLPGHAEAGTRGKTAKRLDPNSARTTHLMNAISCSLLQPGDPGTGSSPIRPQEAAVAPGDCPHATSTPPLIPPSAQGSPAVPTSRSAPRASICWRRVCSSSSFAARTRRDALVTRLRCADSAFTCDTPGSVCWPTRGDQASAPNKALAVGTNRQKRPHADAATCSAGPRPREPPAVAARPPPLPRPVRASRCLLPLDSRPPVRECATCPLLKHIRYCLPPLSRCNERTVYLCLCLSHKQEPVRSSKSAAAEPLGVLTALPGHTTSEAVTPMSSCGASDDAGDADKVEAEVEGVRSSFPSRFSSVACVCVCASARVRV